ncbi:MAG: sugar phosphate isomerase/epimerase, partial [Actinobacteria bacterium]|nr:sugar phosphate isomerase/epimerase [Actinomycetota bacterium]
VYADKPWADACKAAKEAGLKAIEPGTGGFVGKAHCNPHELLKDKNAVKAWMKAAEKNGLEISALSCHGNMLHPDKKVSDEHISDFEATIELASATGVKAINGFGGCPGANENSRDPNWITCPWPPYFGEAVRWQWEKRVIPFWTEMAKKMRKAAVVVALEMHPGDVVYNTEALLALREAVGEQICCNFDPSHLFWQGMDPIVCIKRLGSAIVHVHAKDSKVDPSVVQFRGVNDWKHYSEIAKRAWTFRTVGYGHGSEFWNEFVSTLRLVGYDGVISIEHEDPLMSADEGMAKAISFLKGVLLYEKVGEMWWA